MRKRKKMKWNKLRIWCKERLLRLKKPFIIVGCVWFVACIAGFFFNCLFTYHFKFRLDINLLVDGKTYLYALLLSAIALTVALAYYYKHYWLKNSKKIIQGDERDNDVTANLEQAHFQTDGEVDKNYAKISYAELPKTNLVGIPIRAVERKGDYEIHFAKNAHTMIIGTTECRNLCEPMVKEKADRLASLICFSMSSMCDFVGRSGMAFSWKLYVITSLFSYHIISRIKVFTRSFRILISFGSSNTFARRYFSPSSTVR